MNLKLWVSHLFHVHNIGLIYQLRVLHGNIHEWLLWKKAYLFEKRGNKVVATAFRGKVYGDNPRYIIEKIHELSPETEIVWICSLNTSEKVPNYIRTICYENQNDRIHELATASIIIDSSRCFSDLNKRKDQMHIETWHGGLGFKKIGIDAVVNAEKQRKIGRNAYDFYLSNSDHLTKVYRSAFKYTGSVWKCGFPIEEELILDINERRRICEQYNIDEDTKILMYAPTFRTQYRWKSALNVRNALEACHQRFGGCWKLLVHWHPNMHKEDRILAEGICIDGIDSMQELVKVADAFITDYSSSVFQAVQRHIPCFVYADDNEEYNMDRGLYYPLDEQPFPYALTNEQLIDNILHYDPAIWNEKWQQYAKRMGHIVTGHSAEDVAKVCVDFLNGKSKEDIMKEIPFETGL